MEQITLNQWIEWKEEIRKKLHETAENFVWIGYRMKQIRDTEAYKQDGCNSIAEWAYKEYGIDKTAVSRFIAINEKFSEDGNSMIMRKEFVGLGSSKLSEMLMLPENDYNLIDVKSSVEDIREIKRFNKTEPDQENKEFIYTPLQKCLIDYFQDQNRHDMLNNIMKLVWDEPRDYKKAAEEMNPTEHGSWKKGIIFLFFYDYRTGVKIKTFGKEENESMSWHDLLDIVFIIYASVNSDPENTDFWCKHYGPIVKEKTEEKTEVETSIKKPDEKKQKKVEKPIPPVNKFNQAKEDILKQLDSPIEELEEIEEVEQELQEEEVIELDELENEDISISEEVAAVIESLEEPILERNTSAWQYALQEALAAVKTKHYIMAENYTKNAMEECQKYMNGCDTSRNQDNSESHAE